MRERDRAEAAELMRRILALVDSGELSADGPAGSGLVRRLEGALLAVEAMEPRRQRNPERVSPPRTSGEPT